MNISSYLLAGFAILPKTDMTIGATTVECVFNQSTHRDDKAFGGFEPSDEATVSVKTSLLTNPKTLKGTTVTIESAVWRIISVTYGQSITHLGLISADKT